MPQITVLKPFKFAHRGVEIEEFEPHPDGEPRDATQELVDHAGLVEEGYIEIVGAELQEEEASAPAPAPQNPAAPAPAPVEQQPAPPAPPAPAPAAKKTARNKG